MPTVMTTASRVATAPWATVWAPTRQRAQSTHITSGDNTSRTGPKSGTHTVTLPAMSPRWSVTLQRAPCMTALAIITLTTTEATVANWPARRGKGAALDADASGVGRG